MWLVESACVLILVLYAWLHRGDEGWTRDAALLAAAGWIGEETCIRAYHFYQYAPTWHARILDVPLLIAAIWPAVVLSARAVARSLLRPAHDAGHVALITGALVVFDAALIEPIAVRAGLWSWNEQGVFAVPVIGILGWGFFAAAASYVLERTKGWRRLSVLAIAPIATHAQLLVAWWVLFRWMLRATISQVAGVSVIGAIGLAYALVVLQRRAGLSGTELAARGVATCLFGVLLALHGDRWLLAYAVAFTPPHLLLCARAIKPGGAFAKRTPSPVRAPRS